MDYVLIGSTVVALAVVTASVLSWWKQSSDARESKQAHEAAQNREPPVDLGDTCEFGITEFTDHHGGERVAVGTVEGFVLFTEDVPRELEVGDVIRAKVMAFNKDHTSADATFIESQ